MTGMVDFEFEFQYAEAKQTALRDIRLPERLIMIVAVIFRFFPVLSGDMKLLRQSVATRGVFAAPWEELRALPAYLEILTVPMALRVIRIAETLSASAETRGIDLKRRKSNFRQRHDAHDESVAHRPQAPQEQFSVAPLLRA